MSLDFEAELAKLRTTYLASIPAKLDELTSLLATDDPNARVIVHRLAGTCGSYGFIALGDACKALERALVAGEPTDELLARVRTELGILTP